MFKRKVWFIKREDTVWKPNLKKEFMRKMKKKEVLRINIKKDYLAGLTYFQLQKENKV
jgi:hypothetical protein